MSGKVVIIGGNKRAGKTTISLKLQKEYQFNYYNFDMLLDSLEESLPILNDKDDKKYISLLESMVKRSLIDAENYGINFVYEYIFTPEELANFKYRDCVQIIFLANLDANLENIEGDLKKYSKEYDWPSFVNEDDLNRNIRWILNRNEELIDECSKYCFPLINTSRGDERDRIIDNVINNLLEGKYENNSISKQ
ncbi:MAG: hypothetical protein OSJ70_05735 [Bacilli bacterium]|nr:hypothetical protein [Bacilli bacterium]